MAFDVAAAKQAGYSTAEIAEFLGKQKGFDAAGAMKAGYSPDELIAYLGAEAPKTTAFGQVKEGFKGLIPGAVGLAESAAIGASALLPEDMEKSAREKIKSVATAAKEPFAAAAGYEDTVGRKLGEAVGSTIPFLAAGPLGLAGRAAAVGLGVGAGAGEARTRAEADSATGEQRGMATALGTIPGALEAFAPIRILSRIPTASKAAGVEAVKRAMVAGGEEAAQEAASGFAQNLIAKGIYKPEQALIEGLGEQAAYGGATGAIVQGLLDLALGRRARGAQTTPPAPEAQPGPQLAPDAPVGTQGTMFTPEEMGKPVPAPKAPEEPVAAGVPEGQLDLGLDYQREYADLVKERERLKQQPQTPEVKARVQELTGQMALYTQSDIESMRAEKEGQAAAAAEDAAARKKFPALAEAPDILTKPDEVKARTQGELFPDEELAGPTLREKEKPTAEKPAEPGEPTPVPSYTRTGPYQKKLPLRGGEVAQPFTLKDVEDTGIAPSTTRGWFEQNVVGKTQAEVQALVDKTPTLLVGNGKRAKILRELLAPQAAPFKETPRVEPTPAPTPAVEPRAEPRASEPSVGVPSEPAPAELAEPGAGVPATAAEPVTPDGRGLVPAGRPAVQGDETAIGEPAAVTPPVERTADVVHGEVRALEAEQQGLLTKAGRIPAVRSPARAKWDALDAQIAEKKEERDALDRAQRKATPASAKPVVVKPAVAPAPAPAVPAETDAEEAARKAEAEDFKRRLEALEKAKPAAAKPAPAPAPAPKAEKPEPKEIPEKLREPVGVTDFGGEDTILRGPQGMLFPMSKREESEYAKAKEAEANKEEEETVAPAEKDARQTELDFTKKAEPAAPTISEWAANYSQPGFTAVFGNADVALFRALNRLGGQIYIGVSRARNGRYANTEIESYTGADFTPEQRETLLAARSKAVFEESKRAAKNPDGPFTGASTNVVKSDSVDQRYADLLQNLMRSMGLGDVRVFLVHPEDMRGPNAQAKYKLYKSYETAQTAGFGAGEEGSTQPMGPEKRDFYISFKSGMSENKSIEVITHELGHMIQAIAFNNAPADVQAAIKKEHADWLQTTKGRTGRELVQMLRNRETAETQMLSVPEGKTAEQMSAYWRSFSEWFADNTSRWASTSDKPVTITEKFFSRVAQMMRDLVATVTGRKYPPNKKVAEFLDAMGPGSAKLWVTGKDAAVQPSGKAEFSVAPGTEALIDSMGPMEQQEKPMLRKIIDGFKTQSEPGYAVKFRTQTADAAATIEHRLREQFDGAVRDKLGKFNPMGLYRQAQDYSKMLLEYMQVGAIAKEPATGLWKVKADPKVRPPVEVYSLIDKWAAKNGYSRERGTQIASRILEGVRLDAMRTSNKNDGTSFLLHLKDNEIDQLVREYKADPDLQAMSKAMDEARLAMVDNMVKVGRLSAEQGQVWKDAAGYVPFDRIEDFATSFTKIKKVSNKGLAQVGKLPELVGSINRPVGNVFDNYLNTLGWMVGQTIKTDGTVQTLRSLEDAGHAKYLGRSPQGKDNTVGMYVKGEMMYWELPSKYDVLAFKDLNPPKAKWLQILGGASNVLRKAVTVLPPFALKQVTDDVQRAIMTSGVKNPGALLRMTLSNFGGLALAELRGIQHPTVKQFGALGLTGEYDFQQGKPATSVLKDLGFKPRGKFETLIHRLDGITRASDLAVRKAIYDQTLNETKDQLLAQTRAREFINFRRRGASDFVGAMVTTIPFFNAYIQGMDVLYRAASGKDSSSSVGRAQARRMFWSRAAIAMTLSSLYALGKGDDDEDYNEMDLRVRDGNWILPGGFKLPVPGELGALFKVIPERVVEYMRRQGTPEEQEAWEATRTALTYIFEQYVGRVVPVPQGVKPLLEAWTNYSFFTGRELEGIYQKQQDPSLRRASNTSELAIAIANFSKDVVGVDKISPIMIDNALNGYFGSTAGLLVAVTDSLLNPTRVDRPLHKYALVSNYMYDPVGTRRMTEFYEAREKVGRANTTLNELMKTDLDKAAAYAEEHADELMLESAVNSTLEQLERTRAYKKYLNSKLAAEDMTSDERADQIKEIREMETELTGWLREAKASLR